MQVRKQDLVRAEHRAFVQLRLFDLDDHFGSGKNLFSRAYNRGACSFVCGIGFANASSGILLYDDFVAIGNNLMHARRCHADAELKGLNLFRYTNLHGLSPNRK